MEKLKELYQEPLMEALFVAAVDVITTSVPGLNVSTQTTPSSKDEAWSGFF